MNPSQGALVAALVASQVGLGAAYVVQIRRIRGQPRSVWGRISSARARTYYLMTALVAYLAHLALAVLLAARNDVAPNTRYLFAAGLVAYYAMQFFFLDLLLQAVVTGSRSAVRVLLGACVLPMGVCAWAAGRYAWSLRRRGKTSVAAVVATLAALPLAHVLVNDFALFSFRF
mgnify:CR=1 FL=1